MPHPGFRFTCPGWHLYTPESRRPTKLSSAHNRPAPEAVTSARPDVQPTGAPAFRAFLRHRSTLVSFLRQAGFVALGRASACRDR